MSTGFYVKYLWDLVDYQLLKSLLGKLAIWIDRIFSKKLIKSKRVGSIQAVDLLNSMPEGSHLWDCVPVNVSCFERDIYTPTGCNPWPVRKSPLR